MCSNILGLPHFPQPLQMEERTMLQATTVIIASDAFLQLEEIPEIGCDPCIPTLKIPTLKDFCHSKKGAPILEEAKKHGPSVAKFLTDAIGLVDKGTPRTKVPRFSEPSGGHAGNSGMSNYVRMISTCLLKECSHLGWCSSKLAGLAARVTKIYRRNTPLIDFRSS